MTFGRIDFFEMLFDFMLLQVIRLESLMRDENVTHFIKRHAVLDKESYTGVQEADVALKHEVALGLRRDA